MRGVARSFRAVTARPVVSYVPAMPRLLSLCRNLAASLGVSHRWISCRRTWKEVASQFKSARLVVIWNGLQKETCLCARFCRARGIPCLFVEHGFLEQSDSWWADPQGLCGDSVLNGDLSWVEKRDMEHLRRVRADLLLRFPRVPEPDQVLVPLQIPSDSQVQFFSSYNSMGEFAEEVLARCPGSRVVFRQHPRLRTDEKLPAGATVQIADCPFLECARRASRVFGITSTCLLEAAALGVPVQAFGDHPLRHHPAAIHDRVVAGALALRVPKAGGNLTSVIDRFGTGARLGGVVAPAGADDLRRVNERVWTTREDAPCH